MYVRSEDYPAGPQSTYACGLFPELGKWRELQKLKGQKANVPRARRKDMIKHAMYVYLVTLRMKDGMSATVRSSLAELSAYTLIVGIADEML